MPEESAKAAIFLSYASQDTDSARRLAEALRAAGLEVWFDQDELRGGDEWDRKIKNQIRTCALFVPIISASTQSRPEGYFRLEWHLAEQRSLLIAKGRAFIVPVCIDETRETEALVPDAFLAVQWSRPHSDAKLTQFVAQVQRLLTQPQSSSRRSLPGGATSPATPAAPVIPDFELLRQIGRGSYGDVWLARSATGLWRAIKIVWRERFSDAEPFEREWRGLKEFAAISLGESTQLALLHVGRNDEAGFFFYVMELADDAERGRAIDPATYVPLTLTQLRTRRSRLPAAECGRYGLELARVLAGLHRRGLLHRDIKPSNIILVNGVPKLADIGLVAPVTDANTFVGTEGFVPPEGPGSPSADVYALGKVLYELVTGLDRHEFPQLPPELARLPDHRALLALNEIILRACEPAPDQRYRDAAALAADLERWGAGRPPRRRIGWPLAVAAGLALLATGVIGVKGWRRPAAETAPTAAARQSVAVLPFANLSGDPAQDYFSDGLAEQVLDALARERDLGVPGRTSSFSFKGRNLPAAEIARALNVAQLVEGSVQRAGGRVRINVRLTRAADGFSESLGNFDREATDIFALQDEVARAVVEKLTRRAPTRVAMALTRHPEAYDAYLRGRALQVRSAVDAPAAVKLFEQAVALDPKFALAWARLSQARFRGYGGMNDRSPAVVDSSREAVDRALALQPDLPEALIARAHWLRAAASDYAAAQRDLARAEALQPATAELRFAQCLLARDTDNWPEAVRLSREALRLDPQNGDAINAIAISIFAPRGDYPEADRLYAQAMAIQGPGNLLPFRNRVILRMAWRGPEAALRLIERAPAGQAGKENLRARVLRLLGRPAEAPASAGQAAAPAGSVASFQGRNDGSLSQPAADGTDSQQTARAEEIRADSRREFARGNRAPLVRLVYIQAELTLGHRDAALAELEQWRREAQQRPSAFGRIFEFNLLASDFYARLGRPEETKTLLREILAHGFQPVFSMRPDLSFTDLHRDPTFAELVKAADAWAAAQPDPLDDPAPAPVKPPAPSPSATAASKSLIVLPLENLSPDPADAFFADGMHEEIIQTLLRVGGLKVLSRATALTLKGKGDALAAIGQRFGVEYALSGSLRRSGKNVRVSLELRKTTDESVVWQRRFDREFDNGFALQDEIAAEVAKALQVHTSTGWFAGAKYMTKNAEAYELFLRARDLPATKGPSAATFQEQVRLGEQAMALDPDFMSGASMLSQAYSYLYTSGRGTLDAKERANVAVKAKYWGERASALMPGGAGDGALAVYYSRVEDDPERALVYAQNEVRALPNDPNSYNRLGLVSNWGRVREALDAYNRALALDPMHVRALYNRIRVAAFVRDVPAFEEAAAKSLEYGGNNINRYEIFEYRFNLTGQLPEGIYRYPDALFGDARLLWLGRKFAELLTEVERVLTTPVGQQLGARFGALRWRAQAAHQLGQKTVFAEAVAAMAAIAEKEAVAAGWPENRVQAMQAEALMLADRKAEAIGIARRLIEGLAAPARTSERWGREWDLALIHAWFGDKRECVEILRRLLVVPSGVTVPNLRLAPDWDRVRDDPGFQALLADPKNSWPLGDDGPIPPAPESTMRLNVPGITAAPIAPAAGEKPTPATTAALDNKSLIVLPLENLSPDPDNAFFTDGMHAEIIALLGRAPELRVVSRASALTLKGAALPLTEAAAKFSVANVMTGSVRRAGRQVRIQLELRRAKDEAVLWSRTYDEELTNPLALQTDIADNVTRALQARESVGTFGGARFLTKNPQAFDLFLKARGLFEIGDFRGEGMLQAEKLLKQALEQDPGFVSAASLLTNLIADLSRGARDPAQKVAYAAEAKRYAELAARLAPGGAGDASLAFYYAVIEGEGAKALPLADNAVRALPNDAVHHNIRGIALAHLGRAHEALAAFRRARELDPTTPVFRTNELQSLVALRRLAEFETELASDRGRTAAAAGLVFRANLELKGELPASVHDMNSITRHLVLWLKRDFAAADASLAQVRTQPPVATLNRFNLLCQHHDVLVRLGRTAEAAQTAREASEYAEKLQAEPEVGLSAKPLYLAQALVRFGRFEEAIARAKQYVEAASASAHPGARCRRERELAEIYATAGRKDECLALLARLIQLPVSRTTVPLLRLDPVWDGVREDPRFQAILADPKNSQPL